MRQCGLPMLYEGHVMVVVQLVMHLFLHQACFIPNFEHVMSEELFFSEKCKAVTFWHQMSYVAYLKGCFSLLSQVQKAPSGG